MSIGVSRLLHQDAVRKRELDTMLVNQKDKVVVLQAEISKLETDFQKLVEAEKEKDKARKGITDRVNKVIESLTDQLKYTEKIDRRHKRQRNVLGALLVLVIGVSVVN